ncbi:MAG TPA: VOC family protein [Phycicoccus sp.]|jgi:hypothetical protein|nr:VOC family protein [Phycicoccus sp.]HQK30448.1 VOC family protein [Phycicoccus sp.]HRA45358.1 VOC family protein [Phycicoccus sp.]
MSTTAEMTQTAQMTQTAETTERTRGVSENRIDHLVIAAEDLVRGRKWVEEMLGVPMQPGGEHQMWGTHNVLLGLGGGTYLEVLAINSAVPQPGPFYPLGLGVPEVQRQLRLSPQVLHWFARVEGFQGEGVEEFSRGQNRWRARMPTDGHLIEDGIVPSQIEWLTPPPATLLPDSGVRLTELTLVTPEPDDLTSRLADHLLDPRIQVREGDRRELQATFTTPRGEVTL